jgi:hypothetical protein
MAAAHSHIPATTLLASAGSASANGGGDAVSRRSPSCTIVAVTSA